MCTVLLGCILPTIVTNLPCCADWRRDCRGCLLDRDAGPQRKRKAWVSTALHSNRESRRVIIDSLLYFDFILITLDDSRCSFLILQALFCDFCWSFVHRDWCIIFTKLTAPSHWYLPQNTSLSYEDSHRYKHCLCLRQLYAKQLRCQGYRLLHTFEYVLLLLLQVKPVIN